MNLEEVMETMVALWQQILPEQEIDVQESIFVFGADSIKIMGMMNQLQEKYGITLEVTDVFEHDTIQDLSRVILEKALEKSA